MAVDSADAADTDSERAETKLVAVLCGLDESVEPWKLRPPESADGPAKLLVGAQLGLVRSRLESAGYTVHDLGLPVERDGWLAAWKIS